MCVVNGEWASQNCKCFIVSIPVLKNTKGKLSLKQIEKSMKLGCNIKVSRELYPQLKLLF